MVKHHELVNGGKLNLCNVQPTGPLLCYLIPIVALPCGEEYEFFYCPISLVVKSRDGQVDAPLHVAGGIFI